MIGALQAIRAHHLRVPEDISVVGFVGHRTYGQTTVDPDHRWLIPVEPLLDD